MASPAADPRVDDTRGNGHVGRSAANESTPLLARQDEESRSSQPALWEKIKAWRRDRAVLAGLLLLVAVALIVTIVVLAGKPQLYPFISPNSIAVYHPNLQSHSPLSSPLITFCNTFLTLKAPQTFCL